MRHRSRPSRVIVIASLAIVLVGVGAYGVFLAIRPSPEVMEATAAMAKPTEVAVVEAEPAPVETRPPDIFEEFRFQIAALDRPWVKVDHKGVSPLSCLAYQRTFPDAIFFVIAESDSAGWISDSSELAETAMKQLASASSESTVLRKQKKVVGETPGIEIHSRARVGGRWFAYVHWVSAHEGFLYQLVVAGDPREEALVRMEADRIQRGFSLIDRESERDGR